jgi:hypothetical protein
MNNHLESSPEGVVRRLLDTCTRCDTEVACRIGLSCDAVAEHMKRKRRGEMIDFAGEYGPAVDLWSGAAHAGSDVSVALSTLFPSEVQARRLLA